MKTCDKCVHFKVCKIVDKMKKSLKQHRKSFIPEGEGGPAELMYQAVGQGCLHWKEAAEESNGG